MSIKYSFVAGGQQMYLTNPDQLIQQENLSQQQRYSPASNLDHEVEEKLDRLDCESVQSEPVRNLPVEMHKRDSLSDSGAEGSGTNTPTRGRTFTEGLLRFVHDSNLQKPVPERRVSNIEQPVMGHQSKSRGVHGNSSVQVPVIQAANNAPPFTAINPPQFSGVIQQTHIPEPAYPSELTADFRTASLTSLSSHGGYQGYSNSSNTIHGHLPQYAYIPGVSIPSSVFQVRTTPLNSSMAPVRQQESRLASSLIMGGETNSVRQPIMSSTAQPSMGYNTMTGMMPMMMMPNTSQAMYTSARYQPVHGTPISPPGPVDHRASPATGFMPSNVMGQASNPAYVNLPSVNNVQNTYRPLPGYSNLPVNLTQGTRIIPEPSQGLVHDPVNINMLNSSSGVLNQGSGALNPVPGLINPGPALLNNPVILNQGQAVINPATLAGIAINHPLTLPGASYTLPTGGGLNQSVNMPSTASSIAGSMAGSYHESTHAEDSSVYGTNLDLEPQI